MNKKQKQQLSEIKPKTRKYTKTMLQIQELNRIRRRKILMVILIILIILGAFFAYWMTNLRYTASELVGTWKATTCVYGDQTMDITELYGKFNVVLKKKGNCSIVTGSYKVNGKWAPTWNLKGFKFVASDSDTDDQEPLVFKKKGKNKIQLEDNGIKYNFERQTKSGQ